MTAFRRTVSLAARLSWLARVSLSAAIPVAGLAIVAPSVGCETYVPAPTARLEDLKDGLIENASAPIIVSFSQPVKFDTLTLRVIVLEAKNGRLADEDDDDSTTLNTLYETSMQGEIGGTGTLSPDGHFFVISPTARFPVGPKLAIVVDSGLTDSNGRITTYRQVIPFAYSFKCSGTKGTTKVKSGDYYFLLNVEKPLQLQIQVLANLRVDPDTGTVIGQFTRARRSEVQKCPQGCDPSKDVCRLLPTPQCVAPSTKADSVDEYPDWVPNSTVENGFSFTVRGCVEEQDDGRVIFGTAPANLVVKNPPVAVNALTVNASFTVDAATGVARLGGGIKGEAIRFGEGELGPGEGTILGLSIPADERIPQPPADAK